MGGDMTESPCTTPDNLNGTCVKLQQCASLFSLLTPPVSEKSRQFLRQSQCGLEGWNPLVRLIFNNLILTTRITYQINCRFAVNFHSLCPIFQLQDFAEHTQKADFQMQLTNITFSQTTRGMTHSNSFRNNIISLIMDSLFTGRLFSTTKSVWLQRDC